MLVYAFLLLDLALAHCPYTQAQKDHDLYKEAGDGSQENVLALLRCKADIDHSGRNPLIRAGQHGHTDVIKALLSHRANVNVQNQIGKTALMYIAGFDFLTDTVNTLLTYRANINLKSDKGKTAIDFAVDNEIVDMLQQWAQAPWTTTITVTTTTATVTTLTTTVTTSTTTVTTSTATVTTVTTTTVSTITATTTTTTATTVTTTTVTTVTATTVTTTATVTTVTTTTVTTVTATTVTTSTTTVTTSTTTLTTVTTTTLPFQDTPGWQNNEGFTCQDYGRRWCQNGGFRPGSEWTGSPEVGVGSDSRCAKHLNAHKTNCAMVYNYPALHCIFCGKKKAERIIEITTTITTTTWAPAPTPVPTPVSILVSGFALLIMSACGALACYKAYCCAHAQPQQVQDTTEPTSTDTDPLLNPHSWA